MLNKIQIPYNNKQSMNYLVQILINYEKMLVKILIIMNVYKIFYQTILVM